MFENTIFYTKKMFENINKLTILSEFAYFASYALNRLRSDMQYSFRSRQSLRLKRVLA